MAEGFLKGLWGKPAVEATGLMGLWGTIKSAPSRITGAIMSPLKLITYVILAAIAFIAYSRFKK